MDRVAQTDKIATEFNSGISRLINFFQKIDPNNVNLDVVRRKLSIVKDIDPLLLINHSHGPIWEHREAILAEDEGFFLAAEYNEYYEQEEDKDTISRVILMVKEQYQKLSSAEKKTIWGEVKNLLRKCIEYKKVTGEFSQ